MKIESFLVFLDLFFIRKEIGGCFEVVEALGFSLEHFFTKCPLCV